MPQLGMKIAKYKDASAQHEYVSVLHESQPLARPTKYPQSEAQHKDVSAQYEDGLATSMIVS